MSLTVKRLWFVCLMVIFSGCGDWFSSTNSKTAKKNTQAVIEVINKQDFEQIVLKSEKPVVVDFWATWCGACKKMSPIFSKIAGELGKTYKFVSIDVDKGKAIADEYGISAIPAFFFFKNGQKVGQVVGAQDEASFKKAIEDTLK